MEKLKILVAEDDKVTQVLYTKGLPEDFCELRVVANGEDALRVYHQWKPDIILLDISMPFLNGYQVLKEIREVRKDPAIPIIMVTSISDKREIVACAQLGIQGYIVKPFKAGSIGTQVMDIYKKYKSGAK